VVVVVVVVVKATKVKVKDAEIAGLTSEKGCSIRLYVLFDECICYKSK
jgi:hypothetical protein